MRTDIHEMLERQAAWQRNRRSLPWSEKLRMSIAMRATVLSLNPARGARSLVKEPPVDYETGATRQPQCE